MNRIDGRLADQIRKCKITKHYQKNPAGSVLIEMGNTKVICAANIQNSVPPFLRGSGTGWLNAEYSLLPSATATRNSREATRGKLSGRTQEIQRLIGRSLRSVMDFQALGEQTIMLDCDVLEADGGTRTASITGAFMALALALDTIYDPSKPFPLKDFVAAISVGINTDGEALLDLCYEEDSTAVTDMNIVMTGNNEFIEIQGTGEKAPFSHEDLTKMLSLAHSGIDELISYQKDVLGNHLSWKIGRVP